MIPYAHNYSDQPLHSWKTSSSTNRWVSHSLEERSGKSFNFEHVVDVGIQHFAVPVISHMATIVHASNLVIMQKIIKTIHQHGI